MTASTTDGGAAPSRSAKAAHVNMMTDTVIANLPADGLRSVIRGLLGVEMSLTSHFHDLADKYIIATKPETTPSGLFEKTSSGLGSTQKFAETQGRIRCSMGCGHGFESISTLTDVLGQLLEQHYKDDTIGDGFLSALAAIDGDIVQAVTAVQKELLTGSGVRAMTTPEQKIVKKLESSLLAWSELANDTELEYVFARGFARVEEFGGRSPSVPRKVESTSQSLTRKSKIAETVQLGSLTVPRMFMGLWQFSSPAWGTASRTQINAHFRKHVDAGFTSYGMTLFLFPSTRSFILTYM